MKRKIKVLLYACILLNLIIFLSACNSPDDKLKENSSISDNNTREYSDFFSLRDVDLEYIDDAAYEELKETLGQVEWYPEFEPGKKEGLELHLQKYKELLLMEREYLNPSNGEKATLDSLIARQINEPDGSHLYYDMEANHYYIYDFDGDGAQELCVEVIAPVSIYVFKYDVQNDEVYLWYETGSYSQLGGTRTVFSGDGRPEYMNILNEYGEEESTYMNYCGYKYIIAIPCKNAEGEIIVSDELYENSYQIVNGDGRGYFYVTEEQFEELGQYMRDARVWAEKEIKKYQYTYDMNADQIFESYDDMANELDFVNEDVFIDINKIFEEVEWYTDFNKGDSEKYDLYLSKYAELILLKRPYKSEIDGNVQMIEELLKTPDAGDVFSVHMDSYDYYVYDYDGDGKTELCIKDIGRIFVFRYDESEDCIYLVDSMGGNASLGGTGTQYAHGGNTNQLLKIETCGDVIKRREEFTFYLCEGDEYLLTLPSYVAREGNYLVTDQMKEQGDLLGNEEGGSYYFKITKEQYTELISYYLDAEEKTNQNIGEVRYQYDEIVKAVKYDR